MICQNLRCLGDVVHACIHVRFDRLALALLHYTPRRDSSGRSWPVTHSDWPADQSELGTSPEEPAGGALSRAVQQSRLHLGHPRM